MLGIIGGLVALALAAVYCALILGKRTDQRIAKYLREEQVATPMTVRFPDDVLRARTSSATQG